MFDQRNQVFPRNDLLHLLKEFALAGLLGGKVQAEVSLLHRPGCCRTQHACASTCVGDLCRGSLDRQVLRKLLPPELPLWGQISNNRKRAPNFIARNPYLFWSEWRDSNSRPLAPHASALPGCATFRVVAANYREEKQPPREKHSLFSKKCKKAPPKSFPRCLHMLSTCRYMHRQAKLQR